MVGAAAGLLAIAGLFAIARVTGLSEWVGLALIVGEDGVFSPSTGVPLAWAVPPLAAAVIGALTGPAAARGVRWSGWWMGYLTYGLGIVIGALVLVLLPTGVIGSSTDVQVGPLDLVGRRPRPRRRGGHHRRAGPGDVRARRDRLGGRRPTPGARPTAGSDPGGRPIIVMGVVAGVLALLWLTITTFLDVLVNSQLD